MKFLSHFWYKILNQLGSFPSARNMLTVEIFDDLKGKGLDIGHLGDYSFKNKDITREIRALSAVQEYMTRILAGN